MTSFERQHEITEFINQEAELFDEWRLREWLDLLTPDVVYQVPVRVSREPSDGNRVTGVRRRTGLTTSRAFPYLIWCRRKGV